MDLTDLLTALRYRWRWLVSVVVLGVLVAGLAAGLAPRQYVSTTTLYIDPSKIDQSSSTTDVTSTYAALARSETVARLAVDELDLDVSARTFLSHVTTTVSPGTYLLEISVSDSSSAGARTAASTLARVLTVYLGAVATSSTVDPGKLDLDEVPASSPVSVVQPASDPNGRAASKLVVALPAGLLAGLVLGALVAVAVELRRRRVRSVATLSAVDPRIVVLGRVGLVTRDLQSNDDPALTDSFRTLAAALTSGPKPPKTLCITSCGPDTSAFLSSRLAVVLVDAGRSVVLVDADARHGRLTTLLEQDDQPGLTDVLQGTDAHDVTQSLGSGLTFLPSGPLGRDGGAVAASPALTDVLVTLGEDGAATVVSTAPVSQVVDAALVGRSTDLTVLAVVLHQTSWRELRAALDATSAAGTRRPVVVVVDVVRGPSRRARRRS